MHDFKKLNVWQEAVELVTDVYEVTRKFPAEEKFGLISQINRAAVSIPSNIAEGAGRRSSGEFGIFLGYATGSCYELETQLIIANKIGVLPKAELSKLSSRLSSIQKMIYTLNKSLEKTSKSQYPIPTT